jgi:5-methylcytosine-specific restriction enzyme A
LAQSSKWKTNRTIRNKALEIAGRKCEIDYSHTTFEDSNENTFMEGHHLIPLEYQDLFTESLDFLENIVSLCPTCHREIHHALPKRRKDMASKLFQKRENGLNKVIDIKLSQITSFYEENLEFTEY